MDSLIGEHFKETVRGDTASVSGLERSAKGTGHRVDAHSDRVREVSFQRHQTPIGNTTPSQEAQTFQLPF